jgi:hypothetical protein
LHQEEGVLGVAPEDEAEEDAAGGSTHDLPGVEHANGGGVMSGGQISVKSSQVNTFPKANSKTRSKQNKDIHKCSSVYSERGVPLPVLTSGGE